MATWTDITASGSFMRDTNTDVFNSDVDGTITTGAATITNTDTSGLETGMILNGVGIATDSEILSVDSSSQITIDNNATETNDNVNFEYEIYTDEDLSALHKTAAKEIMYQDLVKEFPYTSDESGLVDELADLNTTTLNQALALLQLCRYYQGNPGETDSTNWNRQNRYCKEYSSMSSNFSNLNRESKGRVTTGRVLL